MQAAERVLPPRRELLRLRERRRGTTRWQDVYGGALHEQSHGESFLALALPALRAARPLHPRRARGRAVADRPARAARGACTSSSTAHSQFMIATHSPILLGLPGRVDLRSSAPTGIEPREYEETEQYRLTRDFLEDRDRFLHHLFRAMTRVRMEGVEPPWVAPPASETGASAWFRHIRGAGRREARPAVVSPASLLPERFELARSPVVRLELAHERLAEEAQRADERVELVQRVVAALARVDVELELDRDGCSRRSRGPCAARSSTGSTWQSSAHAGCRASSRSDVSST